MTAIAGAVTPGRGGIVKWAGSGIHVGLFPKLSQRTWPLVSDDRLARHASRTPGRPGLFAVHQLTIAGA
jgi:hypothetical protein